MSGIEEEQDVVKKQKPRSYVIKFGLHAPTKEVEEAFNQLRSGHNYRNALVEIERQRLQLIQEADDEFGVTELDEKRKALKEAAKTAKKDEKKRLNAQVEQISQKIWDIKNTPAYLKRMHEIDGRKMVPKERPKKGEPKKKKSVAETRNKTKDPNNSIIGKAVRKARRKFCEENGLFWGTYLVVERAMSASKSKSKKGGPKFIRWEGEGHIGIQIQKDNPLKGKGLFEGDARACIRARPLTDKSNRKPDQLVSVHEPKYSRESLAMAVRRNTIRNANGEFKHGERRQAGRVMLQLRIRSDDVQETVTSKRGKTKKVNRKKYTVAEWPMVMHRDIPDDANVTWVQVSRKRVGSKYVWSCEITFSEPMPKAQSQDRKVAAVVFGWRKHGGDRVRVAQWLTLSGNSGELELLDLPIKKDRKLGLHSKSLRRSNLNRFDVDKGRGGIIDGIKLVDHLKGIREKNFNEARGRLVAWMQAQPRIPAWMAKRTTKRSDRVPTKKQAISYIRQWKEGGKKKLAALVIEWRGNRFDGDEEIFNFLEHDWRFNDFHLWNWERRQDDSSRRRRTDVYRNFAASLTKNFGMLIVDGTNFKELKENKDSKLPGRNPASMSQIVAPGSLRLYIQQAAMRDGVVYEKVSAAGTSQRCPKCGTKHKAHANHEDGTFACSRCTFEDQIMHTRLLNMLAANGHESSVQRIIAAMERDKKELRGKLMAIDLPPQPQPRA